MDKETELPYTSRFLPHLWFLASIHPRKLVLKEFQPNQANSKIQNSDSERYPIGFMGGGKKKSICAKKKDPSEYPHWEWGCSTVTAILIELGITWGAVILKIPRTEVATAVHAVRQHHPSVRQSQETRFHKFTELVKGFTEALDFRPPPQEITVQFELVIIIKHVWIGILALCSEHLRVLFILFKDLFLWVPQSSLRGCTENKSFVLKFLEEVRTYHSNFIFFLIVNIFLNNIHWSFSRQTSELGMHLLLAFNGNSTIHCHIFTLKISPTGMQVFIWAGLILYRRRCQGICTTCQ